MVYQLAGFGTLHFIVSRNANWIINLCILGLIVAGYVANREAAYHVERVLMGLLVLAMGITMAYGVLKLKRLQAAYDTNVPPKPPK
jgi:hypothetical protein